MYRYLVGKGIVELGHTPSVYLLNEMHDTQQSASFYDAVLHCARGVWNGRNQGMEAFVSTGKLFLLLETPKPPIQLCVSSTSRFQPYQTTLKTLALHRIPLSGVYDTKTTRVYPLHYDADGTRYVANVFNLATEWHDRIEVIK